MASFNSLTQTEKNEKHREIFGILARHEGQITADGAGKTIDLSAEEIRSIRELQYEIVSDNLTADGVDFRSGEEMKSDLRISAEKMLTKDGYFNPTSGIGTPIDPGMHTRTFVPVSLTPQEATGYYTSGGVPARIIDKKAGCLTLDGIRFECPDLTADDIQKLEAYAEKCGFAEAWKNGLTQALIYGGAAVYPVLAGDNPIRTDREISELLKDLPEKDFISWWVTADRWNVVFVPEYNITARDYLQAKRVFVPLGGCTVNTDRVAMIRPKKLPFWGAIQQMGWATSDFTGWIQDFEAYQIMKASLPIMSQQMSLMYHSFPADGLIIENGPEYAKEFFRQNEKEMRDWSMLHPKAINSIGEIKILERTYTGYQQLIQEARLALCAASSVPESVLFAEKATGLASDNRDDIALKQSEAVRIIFKSAAPAMQPCIRLLVLSCFGKNSEQAKYADNVRILPDSGIILTDQDKAQLGQSFTAIAGSLAAQLGFPLEDAISVAKNFVPSAEIPADLITRIQGAAAAPGEADPDEWKESLWESIRENLGGVSL